MAAIQRGLNESMARVPDAVEAVMLVTDEARRRLLVCDPRDAHERRIMLELWRKDQGRRGGVGSGRLTARS